MLRGVPDSTASSPSLRRVILAASAGTMIEWYDFYIFGTLGVFLSPKFYPPGNTPAVNFLIFLATFATGFAVRPLGALVFGRIGDRTGRKYAFLVTLALMGLSTAVIGLLPTYATIGLAAPIVLVVLRLVQGLALGGEYGGAATYVAEHAPDDRRGYYTSFIQTTATLGLLVSLLVILAARKTLGDAAFKDWGWRLPFLASFVLLAFSLYIRLRLRESPLFAKLKSQGKASSSPLRDSFGNARNWRLVAVALFGATAGQAVVWYTGQFYALFFLQNTLKVPYDTAYAITAAALILGTPFFVIFGHVSDRMGRKPIILGGCLLAALAYVPLYAGMKACSQPVMVPALIGLVWVQVVFVTMVYGPIAAFLVELFPARIRYTSMSLPYHLGNGEFGGWLPFAATAIAAFAASHWQTDGKPDAWTLYAGLAYPIVVALTTVLVGSLLVPETHRVRIWDEVGGAP
jgi:MFS family permease